HSRFLANNILVPEGQYDYVIEANDIHGTASTSLLAVPVTVPQYKQNDLKAYFTASVLQSVSTSVGLGLTGAGQLQFAAPLFIIEFGSLRYACVSYQSAIDPDPNFMVIAAPVAINIPSMNTIPSSSTKQLAQAWVRAVVDLQGRATSLGRY